HFGQYALAMLGTEPASRFPHRFIERRHYALASEVQSNLRCASSRRDPQKHVALEALSVELARAFVERPIVCAIRCVEDDDACRRRRIKSIDERFTAAIAHIQYAAARIDVYPYAAR